MSSKVLIIKSEVNIRRGIGSASAFFVDNKLGVKISAKSGERYDMRGTIITPQISPTNTKGLEQWAEIILPVYPNDRAFVCLRTPDGTELARVEPTPGDTSGDFDRGYRLGKKIAFEEAIQAIQDRSRA